ncbi:MAG: AAA family ATPase [Promethearchaeota archaeon]
MDKNNFLICLTGLPASGKTTFANRLKNALEKNFITLKVKIIDPDLIRKKLTSDKFDPEKEHTVRKENLKLIKSELEKGNIVISDDLNYYSSMRHDLKDIADSLNLNFFIVHIATPLEICLKWNENRGKPIPNEIINKINERFDEFNRYSWDIPIATYDLSKLSDLNLKTEEFLNIINRKIEILKKEVKMSKIQTLSNRDNENLDKVTRNYVGILLDKDKFFPLKRRIIKLRKIFVKKNKNKALTETEISRSFKNFLEKNLNIKISEDLL